MEDETVNLNLLLCQVKDSEYQWLAVNTGKLD